MRLLDLFCGAGGCAVGYHRAGFTEIVGVDNRPQKNYPFAFVQADALEYLGEHGREFDAIHASPPCQAYSASRRMPNAKDEYPDLHGPARDALAAIARPWVIENVEGAPTETAIVLCGTMFGLRVRRHRLFECSTFLFAPAARCRHLAGNIGVRSGTVTILGSCAKKYTTGRGKVQSRPRVARLAVGRAAMGIDWMTLAELGQAIPPAFTEFVGRQLIDHIHHTET